MAVESVIHYDEEQGRIQTEDPTILRIDQNLEALTTPTDTYTPKWNFGSILQIAYENGVHHLAPAEQQDPELSLTGEEILTSAIEDAAQQLLNGSEESHKVEQIETLLTNSQQAQLERIGSKARFADITTLLAATTLYCLEINSPGNTLPENRRLLLASLLAATAETALQQKIIVLADAADILLRIEQDKDSTSAMYYKRQLITSIGISIAISIEAAELVTGNTFPNIPELSSNQNVANAVFATYICLIDWKPQTLDISLPLTDLDKAKQSLTKYLASLSVSPEEDRILTNLGYQRPSTSS